MTGDMPEGYRIHPEGSPQAKSGAADFSRIQYREVRKHNKTQGSVLGSNRDRAHSDIKGHTSKEVNRGEGAVLPPGGIPEHVQGLTGRENHCPAPPAVIIITGETHLVGAVIPGGNAEKWVFPWFLCAFPQRPYKSERKILRWMWEKQPHHAAKSS